MEKYTEFLDAMIATPKRQVVASTSLQPNNEVKTLQQAKSFMQSFSPNSVYFHTFRLAMQFDDKKVCCWPRICPILQIILFVEQYRTGNPTHRAVQTEEPVTKRIKAV